MKIAFNIVCWVAAAYFFVDLHTLAGFPPKEILDGGTFIFVILFAFFLLLPFAQTLEIGSFFKYSAKIEEIKTDVKEFKEETRSLIALQTSLISNVSQSVSHSVNVTLPSLTQARAAEEKLAGVEKAHNADDGNLEEAAQEDTVINYIAASGGDANFALMRLRRDLEIELRRILDKSLRTRSIVASSTSDRPRFYSLISLWNLFLSSFPDQRDSEQAFTYVVDVANAATHGQTVPRETAEEALSMGLRILELLRGT